MEENVTKKDLQGLEDRLEKKIDKAVDDMSNIVQSMMTQIVGEFDKVNTRMDKIERSIDRLTNTLDGFAKRVEDAQVENAARDAQFERLLEWAKEVSKKTGIPLKGF
jgi:septal ring factor EnvC (AmiA/AmiB activator)